MVLLLRFFLLLLGSAAAEPAKVYVDVNVAQPDGQVRTHTITAFPDEDPALAAAAFCRRIELPAVGAGAVASALAKEQKWAQLRNRYFLPEQSEQQPATAVRVHSLEEENARLRSELQELQRSGAATAGCVPAAALRAALSRPPTFAGRLRTPAEYELSQHLLDDSTTRRTACDGRLRAHALALAAGLDAVPPGHTHRGASALMLRSVPDRDALALLANDLGLLGEAAELGVWQGFFSHSVLTHWRGSRLHLVDSWAVGVEGGLYDGEDGTGQAQNLAATRANVAQFGEARSKIVQNTTLGAAELYEDGYFDWVYIDATHTYRHCRHDLQPVCSSVCARCSPSLHVLTPGCERLVDGRTGSGRPRFGPGGCSAVMIIGTDSSQRPACVLINLCCSPPIRLHAI